MKDTIEMNIKGEFTLKSYKDGVLQDSFSDRNLVVTGSRSAVAAAMSGIKNPQPINRLTLGTNGHIESISKFSPKQVNGTYNEFGKELHYTEDRTNLFSEELSKTTLDLKFYPVTNSDESQKLSAIAYFNTSEVTTTNTFVEVFADCNSITYIFTIEEGLGHGQDFIAYTEAGLYAGAVLFSMKTFAAKVKDESTQMVLTWKIYF